MLTTTQKQILAITTVIRKGKAACPTKAKAKIKEIKRRAAHSAWLAQ